jgi:hypothetical protein
MAFDEMIEQLSFGRSVPRIDSCLGVFLSPDVIFLAEVKLNGDKPQVLHLVRLPIEQPKDKKTTRAIGTLNTDFLDDQKKIFDVLKKAMTDISWGSKHVMVTLSHHFGILRYFAMPAIDRRFWKTAVPAEAKKYVPIPFATLSHDYQVTDLPVGPDKKPRIGALFGVTHKKNLDNIRLLMKNLGLELIGTELAPCSVERLWDNIDSASAGEPYAQVHFDSGHIRILISESGLPIFFREVFLSQDATVLDRRKVDLGGCIDFTRKQIGSAGPQKIKISGRIADLGNWQKAFSQDLGRQVDYMDADKALGLKGGQWGAYAAVGCALRRLAPTPLSLDLSAVGKISIEDRHAATVILGASAILALLLAVFGGIRFASAIVTKSKVSKIQSTAAGYDKFQGKTANEIALMMDQLQREAKSLGPLARKQLPMTRVFELIGELIPESAWLTGMTLQNPMTIGGRGPGNPRELKITGRVIDSTRSVESDVAYRFAEKLRTDKEFKKAFRSISIEVKAPKASLEGQSTKVKKDFKSTVAERVRNATEFTITCLSRKKK